MKSLVFYGYTIVTIHGDRDYRWNGGQLFFHLIVFKVYLLKQSKKIHKKKTSTKKGERSPIFNEAMIFKVPASTLHVSMYLRPLPNDIPRVGR